MSKNNQPSVLPNVISHVVERDMCIGCGLCITACPNDALSLKWNKYGLLEPVATGQTCSGCPDCLSVCPFSDGLVPGLVLPNEDQLGRSLFLGEEVLGGTTPGEKDQSKAISSQYDVCNAVEYDRYIGFYRNLYVGYAEEYRATSSSGGILTWFLCSLLETGQVDGVLCVKPTDNATEEPYFRYTICKSAAEVRSNAKTRYHPAPVQQAIAIALQHEGRYALAALPCSLKAVRLAQLRFPILRERIVITAGIICGGLKSRNYTKYLAAASGIHVQHLVEPEYRVKQEDSTADDYLFAGTDQKTSVRHFLSMKQLGDMWGTGLFKPNACDYCDDLSAELADISVGDAWIPPYRMDGRGNSVVIVRSKIAAELITAGTEKGEVMLTPVTNLQINESQKGNINHRRVGLAYRLYWAKQEGTPVPRKRVQAQRPENPVIAQVHRLRMRVRRRSHEVWLLQQDTPGTELFDAKLDADLKRLKKLTFVSHIIRNPRLLLALVKQKCLALLKRMYKAIRE
ncbi:MAG: Coenzyme F420 hydrogenase/dehydrogenase, beta subunit C-terminal domain [Caldilineaceae bacterium]|nr:Coenzyme F420 hydrogenase/dehydrogenase, beta subunit C-terminal domain [Caldilineaceae bacterium]